MEFKFLVLFCGISGSDSDTSFAILVRALSTSEDNSVALVLVVSLAFGVVEASLFRAILMIVMGIK